MQNHVVRRMTALLVFGLSAVSLCVILIFGTSTICICGDLK